MQQTKSHISFSTNPDFEYAEIFRSSFAFKLSFTTISKHLTGSFFSFCFLFFLSKIFPLGGTEIRYIFVAALESFRSTPMSEDELVHHLFKKDKHAFTYLYDNYSAALYGVIFRIVQNENTSADIMQEAFVKIWNNFSQYDKTKGKLFTWLVNIARNLAIDTTRSKSFKNQNKNLDVENIVTYIDEDKSTSYNPEQIGLKELLEKLRPEQRDIVDLAYFKGYTQVEIAEALNIPLGTVKTRMRMALIQLRKII